MMLPHNKTHKRRPYCLKCHFTQIASVCLLQTAQRRDGFESNQNISNILPPLSLRKSKTIPVFPPACPFWPTDGRRGKALPSLSLHLGGRQLGPSFQVELTPVCWMFTTSAQQTRPESPRKVHTLPFVGIFFAESTTSTCSQRPTRSQYGPVQ